MESNIIHCKDCAHCFESKRSKTGYKCEMWGYEDFADDTVLDGYCHKAKLTKFPIKPKDSVEV